MKKYFSALLMAVITVTLSMVATSCRDFDPTGYEEGPELATARNIQATVNSDYVVTVSWEAPADNNFTGYLFYKNGDYNNGIELPKNVTRQVIEGQPMGEGVTYTVKCLYKDNKISRGVSAEVLIPQVAFAGVSNLQGTVSGRSVIFNWTNPANNKATGVRVLRDGVEVATFDGQMSTCRVKTQPMEKTFNYTVQLLYKKYYPSTGASVKASIPFVVPKTAFLLLADDIASLPDDDERAAATWYASQADSKLVKISELADLDTDVYSVLWIMIDRQGLPAGWENLPEVSKPENIALLKEFAKGGSLFLSNMATQLTVPLGIVPENMAPTVYSNGTGGSGNDTWTIMPYLGWIFRPGGPNEGEQGYYDRHAHKIFEGLTMSDPNNWGFEGFPMIGPGWREDHNCLWDLNIYGKGSELDVIANWEKTVDCQVLATWGHVQDHCVAVLVDFFANDNHGHCVAMGAAAYEWNQNSGTNVYQQNVEKLTANILEYLK